ncbi:MAG: type II toxin-antitoxin system death-on-curing family toxin [Archaeoglobaceae archaeon]
MAKREAKKIITVEEVIAIHDKLIKKYGGEKGILNYGVLDFAVSWVNDHPRKSIFWKCAILLRDIVLGHPFVDGNKRTGFNIVITLLRTKNYRLEVSREEAIRFLIELAEKGKSIDEIIIWLKKHSKKYEKKSKSKK